MTASDSTAPAASFGGRFLGALMLSRPAFAEIEHDPRSLWQATLVVIAAGAARGIGVYGTEGNAGLIGSVSVGLVLWIVGSVLVWAIGVHALKGTSNVPELLRTLGFGTAPLLLLAVRGLGVMPLDTPLWFVGHTWAIASLTVAAREALDLDTSKALAACILALAAGLALLALLGSTVMKWGAFD